MIHLPGYTLDATFAETATSTLHRGVRDADQRRVVVKVLREEHPSQADLARLRHEHALLAGLDVDEVVKTLGLVPAKNRLALILDDLGEGCVVDMIGRRLELLEFLELALAMCRALEVIHQHGIVHGDIKPDHFFRAGDDNKVRLVDFGIARRLAIETDRHVSPRELEGTLPYLAPEQTGRMNRPVDSRSDQYALGVTLYQLLTGELPFNSMDPLELVHCHLARAPRSPRVVRTDTPEALASIILKMMSKAPEERYKSIAGVSADLALCRARLAQGELAPFVLGRGDTSGELRLPRTLYGREQALAELVKAFERVRTGTPEMMLIAGHSGVGKSALVHELQQAVHRRGRFVAGKFEQLSRHVPYSAVAQALRELLRGLLTESSGSIEVWRQQIASALGVNAALMASLIPELAFLAAPAPSVGTAELSSGNALQRFEHALRELLGVFSGDPEQPLVIFLDDLQWADPASLAILHAVQTKGQKSHILVLGAYRNNEVDAAHPLALALADVRDEGGVIHEISLGSLGRDDVGRFVADALDTPADAVSTLADVVYDKTAGNPFFLGQILLRLRRDGLLTFDSRTRSWCWDDVRVRNMTASDNVVAFMLEQLEDISSDSRTVLQVAACIGFRFDRHTLLAVADLSPTRVATGLWEALRRGLVVPLAGHHFEADMDGDAAEIADLYASYRFLHDRVQQVADELLDAPRREHIHLAVGRLLLARYERDSASEDLAVLVGHLNAGRSVMTDANERRKVAHLNWQAGLNAQGAGALDVARTFLSACTFLLGDGGWTTDYSMAFGATLALADCSFASGAPDEALRLLDILEAKVQSPAERVVGRGLRTTVLCQINRIPEAFACVLETARLVGHALPSEPSDIRAAIGPAFGAVQVARGGRAVQSLGDLPMDESPERTAWAEFVFRAVPVVIQVNPELLVLLVLKTTSILLTEGHTPMSPFLCEQYGLVHHVITGDYAEAYQFGQLGLALARRPPFRAAEGTALFNFATFLSHWQKPVAESIECLRRSLKSSLDLGKQFESEYAAAFGALHHLHSDNLEVVSADLTVLTALCERAGTAIGLQMAALIRQSLANLHGKTTGPLTLDSRANGKDVLDFDEAAFAQSMGQNHSLTALYLIIKCRIFYLAGHFAGALELADRLMCPPGVLMKTDLVLFRGLSAGALAPSVDGAQRETLIEIVRQAAAEYRVWAASCPENFAARHAMLAAELAALTGAIDAAHDLYEQAIRLTEAHHQFGEQAMANELYGRFHLGRNRTSVAKSYLEEARYGYERWGGVAKVAQLNLAYARLLAQPRRRDLFASHRDATMQVAEKSVPIAQRSTVAHTSTSGHLDMLTAVRATQAIASELHLATLLERLMRIVVADAAAQRGFLLLGAGERLQIAARATVEPDLVEANRLEDLEETTDLAVSVVQYVARSHDTVVLGDASRSERFANDPYIRREAPRSLLCLPLERQGQLTGVLYLENNAAPDAFRPDRVELLRFLAVQAAISVENAKLYGEVQAATAELQRANETLEQRVKDRTAELAARNQALRLVLDNVDQGLMTVAAGGHLLMERSAVVDRWFGAYQGEPRASDYFAISDATFAEGLSLGLETLAEGFLPQKLCIEQLPKRLVQGEQQFHCRYLPISDGEQSGAVLMVVDDITSEMLHAREEAEQRELLAVFTAITEDKNGFAQFSSEGAAQLDTIENLAESSDDRKRALHTLKGNGAMLGLGVLASLCDQAENEFEGAGVIEPGTLRQIRARWRAIVETHGRVTGDHAERTVEIGAEEVKVLAEQVRGGATSAQIAQRLESWCSESAAVPLGRLARHAASLAERLGKATPEVSVDGDVAVDPDAFRSLWSTLVHVVRNAVDHGVESPDERKRLGKTVEAHLRLSAHQENTALVFEIEDDGRGIDWNRIRVLATERGLPSDTDQELLNALLAPGVSTRDEVTSTSGRGVGMSDVQKTIGNLGGTLGVKSQVGRGTCWRITFPTNATSVRKATPRRDSVRPS